MTEAQFDEINELVAKLSAICFGLAYNWNDVGLREGVKISEYTPEMPDCLDDAKVREFLRICCERCLKVLTKSS